MYWANSASYPQWGQWSSSWHVGHQLIMVLHTHRLAMYWANSTSYPQWGQWSSSWHVGHQLIMLLHTHRLVMYWANSTSYPQWGQWSSSWHVGHQLIMVLHTHRLVMYWANSTSYPQWGQWSSSWHVGHQPLTAKLFSQHTVTFQHGSHTSRSLQMLFERGHHKCATNFCVNSTETLIRRSRKLYHLSSAYFLWNKLSKTIHI